MKIVLSFMSQVIELVHHEEIKLSDYLMNKNALSYVSFSRARVWDFYVIHDVIVVGVIIFLFILPIYEQGCIELPSIPM